MIRSQRFPRLRTEDDDFRVFLDYLSGIDSVDFLAEAHNIPTASVEMILDVYLDEALADSQEPRFNPKGRPAKFTETQKDEIADKYSQDPNSTLESLALQYNCSLSTIRNVLVEKSISRRKLTPTQELELIRRYKEELDTSLEKLGSDFSISKQGMYKILERHGIDRSRDGIDRSRKSDRAGSDKKLTEEQELELIRRYKEEPHTPLKTLCSDFSVSITLLANLLKKHGIERSRPQGVDRKLTPDQELELIRRYREEPNTPLETLCSNFSISIRTLYNILRQHGIESSHHKRRLTTDQELELIKRYQEEPDTPIEKLCSDFSISMSTFYYFLNRHGIKRSRS